MLEFNLIHSITIYASYAAFFIASLAAVLYLIQDNAIKNKRREVAFNHLPSLYFLDRFNYRSIGLGFPILTISILSGFVWAKSIHGVYWQGYDYRQIYSLVLWLIYALILHVRLTTRLRGRKVAILSIAAFFIMILTLFGACS